MEAEELKSGQESFEDDPNVENEYITDPEEKAEEEAESEESGDAEEAESEPEAEQEKSVSFEEHQKILESQNTANDEMARMKTEIDNYKQLFEMPKFKKLLSEEINQEPSPELMTEFPKDLKVEDLSEKELLNMTAEISENRLIQKLEPVIAGLQDQIKTLLGSESKKEADAFFSDKKNEFANDHKDEITNLTKKGLTYPQAYQVACGEKIAKAEYQRGLAHKKTKSNKDVNLNSKLKGNSSLQNEPMPDDFAHAVEMVTGERFS